MFKMGLLKFLVLELCIGCVFCYMPEWAYRDGPTTELTTESTTMAPDKTDIAQEDIDDALIVDYGRYTTQAFQYFNDQYMIGENEKLNEFNDSCINEYMRCTLSLTAHMPVCAFNEHRPRWGYLDGFSYCDIYFDNCRRGIRVWRILDYGKCHFNYEGVHELNNVKETRRNSAPLIMKLLKILSAQSGNTDISVSKNLQLEPSMDHKEWQDMEGNPMYNFAKHDNGFKRKNNYIITKLLQMLATQPGNTEIHVSKSKSDAYR